MTVKQFTEEAKEHGYSVVVIKTWKKCGLVRGTLIADSNGDVKPIERYNNCEVWHFRNKSPWKAELELWVNVKELEGKNLLYT